VLVITRSPFGEPAIERGAPAPPVKGVTLDGSPFRLADLRGRPVVLNFWGPSCVPCRSEFPLFKAKLAEHSGAGLALVGVLMWDPPEPARAFTAELGATWPTVLDPGERIRAAYRVLGRPQTYFIDREGVLRSIQIGEVTEPDFDRQFGLIAG
jgi:cytochrome c biogenesis protein CcmG/thiol:disulfide interchange protein DsbE